MYEELLTQYESVICNELGEVVARCNDLPGEQVQKILDEHEEYYLRCVEI